MAHSKSLFAHSWLASFTSCAGLIASLSTVGCFASTDATSTDVEDDSASVDSAMPDLAPLFENPDGSAKTKLTVALLVSDDAGGSADPLARTHVLLKSLNTLFASASALTLTKSDPEADMARYTLRSGATISDPSMRLFAKIGAGEIPAGLSAEDALDLDAQVGARATGRFLTFDGALTIPTARVNGANGGVSPIAFEAVVYFGAGRDPAPFKFAMRRADVVLYDGPSFIGSGPLDPSRYASADFSPANQIVFTTGCVSYTQYQADFLDRKPGSASRGALSLVALGDEPGASADVAFARALGTIVGARDLDHAARRMLMVARPAATRTPDTGAAASSVDALGIGASAAHVTSPK